MRIGVSLEIVVRLSQIIHGTAVKVAESRIVTVL